MTCAPTDPRSLRLNARRVCADALRHVPLLARQVGADLLPVDPAVDGLPEHVVAVEEHVRIDCARTRRAAFERSDTTGCRAGPPPPPTGNGSDVRHLPGAPVVARDLAAVHDVRIERIGRRVAVFLHADRMPLAKRDLAVVAAARDAHRSAVLLAAADAIRKRVVRHHVVERRRRLRVPGAPRLAAVQRDDGALVDDEQHDVGIVRIPPDVLVVVAAGRALERHERLAAVGRLVADDVGDDQRVGIFWMNVRHDFVDAAGGPLIGRRTRPGLAGVVGSIDARCHRPALRRSRRDAAGCSARSPAPR